MRVLFVQGGLFYDGNTNYMSDAFFLGLLIFLQAAIFIDIQFIMAYFASRKESGYLKIIATTFAIFVAGLIVLFFMMRNPDAVTRLGIERLMVPESGLIFFVLIFIKARITYRVVLRSRSPEFYDISFFGKKVYRPEVVKKSEIAIYVVSMPFTLITGAYFIANVFT